MGKGDSGRVRSDAVKRRKERDKRRESKKESEREKERERKEEIAEKQKMRTSVASSLLKLQSNGATYLRDGMRFVKTGFPKRAKMTWKDAEVAEM